jgi:hypothetical protein
MKRTLALAIAWPLSWPLSWHRFCRIDDGAAETCLDTGLAVAARKLAEAAKTGTEQAVVPKMSAIRSRPEICACPPPCHNRSDAVNFVRGADFGLQARLDKNVSGLTSSRN